MVNFDESTEEPIVTPDTANRTYFNPGEASPAQQAKFRRLFNYNTGIWTGQWADETERRRLDNLALFDAISGQLELTPRQKREGRETFDSLNIREIGYPADIVAFATCALTVRDDGRDYHPYRKPENNDTEFLRLAANLRFTDDQIASVLARVQDQVSGGR